jgi:methylmalonyl-CoA/ethylmalonyl-CoA epimerase
MTQIPENKKVGIGGLTYDITQISLVVRDMEKTMKAYHRVFGWGPWNVFEHVPPVHHETEYRGKKVHYTLLGAETMVGSVNFELLQPLEGENIWTEWLEKHGEGICSIAVMFKEKEEGDRAKEEFAKLGMSVIQRALIGDHIEYYYVDSIPMLKCWIESGSGHAIDFVKPKYRYP